MIGTLGTLALRSRAAGRRFGLATLVCAAICGSARAAPDWIRQFGTSAHEGAWAVATDGLGSIYTTGITYGSFGATHQGQADIFLTKHDASGNHLWTAQFGGPGYEQAFGVAADALGNIFVSGYQVSTGNAILAKYDALGTQQWLKQVGTATSAEVSYAVAADGLGNAYLTGATTGSFGGTHAGGSDVFLSKYDSLGNAVWTRQLGTPGADEGWGVSVDSLGNVFIAGQTDGALAGPHAGGFDTFVAKYDAAGTFQWSTQLGTALNDIAQGVSVDGLGNVYVAGRTESNLAGAHAGLEDAYLFKIDGSGATLWSRQLGTATVDNAFGVSADALGNVFIAGATLGSLGGPSAGSFDPYVAQYDASGTLVWAEQIGTPALDWGYGVAADGAGKVYVAGYTYGNLQGPNSGPADGYLAKFRVIPEPTNLALGLAATLGLPMALRRRRRSGAATA